MLEKKGGRFEVLDSWRGICAIGVALLHGPVVSHIYAGPILGNAWLFVDFFFVLSGFVISHAYMDGLVTHGEVAAFMIRRFGRVWPLHISVLSFFVCWGVMEAVVTRALHMSFLPSDIFQNPRLAVASILANIALIQDIGLGHFFGANYQWNGPSWSISVEFYTYLIFALICAYGRRLANAAAAGVLLLSIGMYLLILEKGDPLDIYQLFECIYGFLVGHFVWRFACRRPLGRNHATAAELISLIIVLIYMLFADLGVIRILAPPIFALTVWVFSAGHGAISSVLKKPPFLKIGALSYSIYMVHFAILRVFLTSAKAAEKFLHIRVMSEHFMPNTGMVPFFDFGNRWLGDLFEVFFIATVIGISSFSFRYIEIPAKNFFYKRAKIVSCHRS